MVGDIFQPTHLLFVLVVALLVLGPKRLPEVGRTLGSGIRDFRQALSGESSHSSQPHDPDQVGSTTTLHDQSEDVTDHAVDWPDEAVGPTSYDEPVEAATAEPATAVQTGAEPATETAVDDRPATESLTDSEPATTVVGGHEPATAHSDSESDQADAPPVSDLDALYFHAPAADTNDSADPRSDQIS